MDKHADKLTQEFVDDAAKQARGFNRLFADGRADHDGGSLCLLVSPAGACTYYLRYSAAKGKRKLERIGKASSLTLKQARDAAKALRDKRNATGRDLGATLKAEAKAKEAAQAAAITFEAALREYIEQKRRGKDGLPLKARTASDYEAMVQPARPAKGKTPARVAGALHGLADVPITEITADDILDVWRAAQARGKRQAVYAAQVLRATLRWHGVQIPDSPFDKNTPGKRRITLGSTARAPTPIPPEAVTAWWRAASAVTGRTKATADALRLMLLSGMRPGEVLGDKHNPPLTVGDVKADRLVRHDTKNRLTHVVHLSRQALAIVTANAEGKKAAEPLFAVQDVRKTLASINKAAGLKPGDHTPHDLRKTLASIAEGLCTYAAVQAMLNHTPADVTGRHYVKIDATRLRESWQAVADHIAGPAAS